MEDIERYSNSSQRNLEDYPIDFDGKPYQSNIEVLLNYDDLAQLLHLAEEYRILRIAIEPKVDQIAIVIEGPDLYQRTAGSQRVRDHEAIARLLLGRSRTFRPDTDVRHRVVDQRWLWLLDFLEDPLIKANWKRFVEMKKGDRDVPDTHNRRII